MTIEEVESVIKELKGQGLNDEQIVYSFSMMFLNKQIEAGAYLGLIELLGYHFVVDFLNMKEKDQIKFVKNLINQR